MAAGSLEQIGAFYLAPGYSTEFMYVFLATELTSSPLPADEDEFLPRGETAGAGGDADGGARRTSRCEVTGGAVAGAAELGKAFLISEYVCKRTRTLFGSALAKAYCGATITIERVSCAENLHVSP